MSTLSKGKLQLGSGVDHIIIYILAILLSLSVTTFVNLDVDGGL